MSPASNQQKNPHVEAIREESALLADWAEMSGDARPSSVDVDEVRSRLMAAAEKLEEQYQAALDVLREITKRPVNGLWSDQAFVDRVRGVLGDPNPASEPNADERATMREAYNAEVEEGVRRLEDSRPSYPASRSAHEG